MKRNFNVVVKNSDGRPHVRALSKYDEDGMPVIENGQPAFDKYEPMTLRQYALDALAGRWKGEENMSNEDMWKRMKLHDRISFANKDDVELTSDEGKTIVDALNHQGSTVLVVGRMKDLFETDPEPVNAA